jgi:hypothetical protein
VAGRPGGVERWWMCCGAACGWGGARVWVSWAEERLGEADTGGVFGGGPSGQHRRLGQFFATTQLAGEDPWSTAALGAQGWQRTAGVAAR